MMMTTHTAGEDCPSKMKPICTKIKTIHNGEQGQGGGPPNATPCAADFHEFFTPAPQSQCYVHAKTKRIWVLHDFHFVVSLLERIHTTFSARSKREDLLARE